MNEPIQIPNIDDYTQEIIDGTLILTPKKKYITEDELNMLSFSKSSVLECIVKKNDEIISKNKKYRSILVDIWKSMPTQKILQTTTFNFKLTNENGKNGYNWVDEIKMSFQGKDSNKTFTEIISMIKLNKMSIEVSIELESKRIINFKIE